MVERLPAMTLKRDHLGSLFTIILLLSPIGRTAALTGTEANPGAPTTADAWKNASLTLANEAHAIFANTTDPNVESDRENRLGEGATLINVQPKTDANLNAATEILQHLAEKSAPDEIAAYARYLLGRIEQVHRLKPNLPKASEIYRSLLDEMPGSRYAQWALPKLALITLFDPERPSGAPSPAQEIERRAALLTDPDAVRDTYLILADYYTYIERDDAKTLDALVTAQKQEIQGRAFQGNLLIRTAELARKQNRPEVARPAYEEFLSTFPRESRRTLVQKRLSELASSIPSSTPLPVSAGASDVQP